MKKEILPFSGFDIIKLGLPKDKIISILGKPSEAYEEIYPDDTWAIIMKFDIGIECTFNSDEDFVLGSICFLSEEYTLNNLKLIGLSEEEFPIAALNAGIDDLKIDEDFKYLNSKNYLSDSNNLSFWIQDGKVSSITLFPSYDKDGYFPVWPK